MFKDRRSLLLLMVKKYNVIRTPKYRTPWPASRLWEALFAPDPAEVAQKYGYSRDHVIRQARNWNRQKPGGTEDEVVCDRAIFERSELMMDETGVELLVAIAYVRDVEEVLEKMVELAQKGVQVKFMFHADSLTLDMIETFRDSKVDFRMIKWFHGKLIISDTTALESNANWTSTCINRNVQFGKFETNPKIVYEYRKQFLRVFNQSKPFKKKK